MWGEGGAKTVKLLSEYGSESNLHTNTCMSNIVYLYSHWKKILNNETLLMEILVLIAQQSIISNKIYWSPPECALKGEEE